MGTVVRWCLFLYVVFAVTCGETLVDWLCTVLK